MCNMRTYIKNIINKIIIVIFAIALICSTSVMANDETNKQEDNNIESNNQKSQTTEYDFEKIGMKISTPSIMTDMVTALENNDQRLSNYENKEGYIKAYKQSGIVADFVDNIENQLSTEIIIAARTSSSYAEMQNLNDFSEDDKNEYTKRFIEAIKKQEDNNDTQIVVNEGSLIKTNNENNFIKINSVATKEDKSVNIHMYYTIMNGRLITISFRYYQSNNDINNYENDIIQSIKLYDVERPSFSNAGDEVRFALGLSVIMVVILLIIVFFIRRKDKKMLDKNIKDVTVKQYSKFGGLLVFFWTLCFYQILLRVIDISDASSLKNLDFYKNAIIIQSTAVSLISMYQIYITVKRKQDTPKKLIKTNVIMLIVTSAITIIRIMYAIIRPMEVYTNEYFKQEISILITNIIYPLIWIIYFKISNRVQVYYYLPVLKYRETIKQTKIYKLIKNRFTKKGKGKTNEAKAKKHN